MINSVRNVTKFIKRTMTNKTNSTYSRDEAHSIKIGMYAILVITLLFSAYIIRRDLTENQEKNSHYSINARFGRTDGLSIGNDVRLAGVNVGKVIDMQIDENYRVILTMEIKEGIQIPDDSSASIVSNGVLGSKYIELEPGGSEEYLEQGSEISFVRDAMVLEEVVDRIIGLGKAKRQKQKEQK